MNNIVAVFSFLADHYTAIAATLAALGHLFPSKTGAARLADLITANMPTQSAAQPQAPNRGTLNN